MRAEVNTDWRDYNGLYNGYSGLHGEFLAILFHGRTVVPLFTFKHYYLPSSLKPYMKINKTSDYIFITLTSAPLIAL